MSKMPNAKHEPWLVVCFLIISLQLSLTDSHIPCFRYSLDKPPFILVLLNNIGTHIDPRQLVERISPGLEIPGLRASLTTILRDYNLQVALQGGCKKILVSDCFSLLRRRVRTSERGRQVGRSTIACIVVYYSRLSAQVGEGAACPACGVTVLCSNPELMQDLVILNCRHAFHAACLQDLQACTVCQADQFKTQSTYYCNKD